MKCEDLQLLTAWPCRKVKSTHGEDVTLLAPPVRFFDGSAIPVYIFDRGNQIELTDDGTLLEHFEITGLKIGSHKKRRSGLERAIAQWDVTLSDEMQLWCKPDDLSYGLHRFLAALFEASRWESENIGRPLDDDAVIVEAEHHLRVLHPQSQFLHDVTLGGISSRALRFPLKVDETYYAGASSHHASSAAVVKKLFDVRAVVANRDVPITVVIEDSDIERTKGDIQIISQLAHVDRLSDLRARATSQLLSERPQ